MADKIISYHIKQADGTYDNCYFGGSTLTLNHTKIDNIHNLTGVFPQQGLVNINFVPTADFVSDDIIKINDIEYTAKDILNNPISGFKAGVGVTAVVNIDSKLITVGGGGGGNISEMIKVKQYTELPLTVENNIIAVISSKQMNKYTIDINKPDIVSDGDIWVIQSDSDKLLSQHDGNIGILNVHIGGVKQYNENYWRSCEAYLGINNAWIKVSNKFDVYGFRIDKNNSDPNTNVEYLESAVGMTPCYMDYTKGEFNYGSWRDFIDELCTPVMLNYDGTEAYELDKENQNKKADGTASDISNLNFGGNAMVRWNKIYVKAYTDTNYNYVYLSFDKIDDSYKCYTFYNDKGVDQNYIYVPMFKGFKDSNGKLRSIAGQTPTADITITDSYNFAKANGDGWQINYYSFWWLRALILTLISKSTDSQTNFGNGNVSTSDPLITGTLKDKGAFYGYNDNAHQVKCLYSEGVWGDLSDWCNGFVITSDGDIKIKNYAPYSFDDFSNYSVVDNIRGEKTGYLKSANITGNGILGDDLSGSSSTYFCDYFYLYKSTDPYFARVGGSYGSGSNCGAFYLYCIYSVSVSSSYIGASPFYINP